MLLLCFAKITNLNQFGAELFFTEKKSGASANNREEFKKQLNMLGMEIVLWLKQLTDSEGIMIK